MVLLIFIGSSRKHERRDSPDMHSTSASQRGRPAMGRVQKEFLEAISSVPIKPVPRPVTPANHGIGDPLDDSRLSYEIAMQAYAIAQLGGKDEETAKALRQRLPANGWIELGFVPSKLISYEKATVLSGEPIAFVSIRIDRADRWNPQWSTLFGRVAVRCRPADTHFCVVATGTTLEEVSGDVIEAKCPLQRAVQGGLMGKLCGH